MGLELLNKARLTAVTNDTTPPNPTQPNSPPNINHGSALAATQQRSDHLWEISSRVVVAPVTWGR